MKSTRELQDLAALGQDIQVAVDHLNMLLRRADAEGLEIIAVTHNKSGSVLNRPTHVLVAVKLHLE